MKIGGNWWKSDTNLSLWEPRLRCPAVTADGMRTAELDSLVPFSVQPAAHYLNVKYKNLHNVHHTKPRRPIIVQRFGHFVS